MVLLVVLVVLLVLVLDPPVNEDPPVVDVSVDAELDVPPPVAPVLLEPVFELELEPPPVAEFELELEPAAELVVDELLVPLLAVVCVVGLGALVVGTVSGGAPAVPVVPLPLPPHAASATERRTTAALAVRARLLRLRFR
jgi:hypothetical protein